jgi:hypothetical protein
MCNMYIWRKAKHIHKRKNYLLVKDDATYRLLPQRFSWKEKSLVVGLKGLDAKTKLLAVNRQS